MSNIKLTIGITYHNEGELLTECLNSIISQIDATVEILIYDDASTLKPQPFIPSHSAIRILKGEKNIGPAKGRNILLKEARGEYIHFHDSDDWFHKNWYEEVSQYFGKVDAVFSEVTSYRENRLYVEKVMEVTRLKKQNDLLKFAIESFMLVPSGTYRKKILERMNGYREDLWQSEDWDFHVRLALLNPHFVVLEEPLIFIRVRKDSRSQNVEETALDTLKAIKLLKDSIPKSYYCYLADKTAFMGSKLFAIGNINQAREAFRFSQVLGPSNFHWRKNSFQIFAKLFGPIFAEKIGLFFRKS